MLICWGCFTRSGCAACTHQSGLLPTERDALCQSCACGNVSSELKQRLVSTPRPLPEIRASA
eukprot:3776068-Amphidinium_carterae.1